MSTSCTRINPYVVFNKVLRKVMLQNSLQNPNFARAQNAISRDQSIWRQKIGGCGLFWLFLPFFVCVDSCYAYDSG